MLAGLSLVRYVLAAPKYIDPIAPKDIDPQRVIAEVVARFPPALDFELTDMVEKALAWEEVKRNADTPRARVFRASFTSLEDRNYTALLALYARGLTEPIKTEELLSAFRAYSNRAQRKHEKVVKEQLEAIYDLSGEQAVFTDAGREVITEWKDRAMQTGLVRATHAAPRVLDLNRSIAHYFDKADKEVDNIYRNWPTRSGTKGFGTKLVYLLNYAKSQVPFQFNDQSTVASTSYLMPIDVYQKLRGNRVDLFDPACDGMLGGGSRRGENAERQIKYVSPTEADIEAARASEPLPIRGVSADRGAVDVDMDDRGLNTTMISMLRRAGYTRFRLHWIKKHQMILVLDADTGKKLMICTFRRF